LLLCEEGQSRRKGKRYGKKEGNEKSSSYQKKNHGTLNEKGGKKKGPAQSDRVPSYLVDLARKKGGNHRRRRIIFGESKGDNIFEFFKTSRIALKKIFERTVFRGSPNVDC